MRPDYIPCYRLGYAINGFIAPYDNWTYVTFPVTDSEVIDSAGTIVVMDQWYSDGAERGWSWPTMPWDDTNGLQRTDTTGDWFVNKLTSDALTHIYGGDTAAAQADRERHNGGLNYLFYDGHVEWLRPAYIFEHEKALFNPTVIGP